MKLYKNSASEDYAAEVDQRDLAWLEDENFKSLPHSVRVVECLERGIVYQRDHKTLEFQPLAKSSHEQLSIFAYERSFVDDDSQIEKLIFEAQSELRDIDGMHADEALDELIKLAYVCNQFSEFGKPEKSEKFAEYRVASEIRLQLRKLMEKIHAQQGILKTEEDYEFKLSDAAVLAAYKQLARINWEAKEKDKPGRLIQNVIRPAIRSGMGQYFTPPQVIGLMVKVVGMARPKSLLDPYCGSAEILRIAYRECALNGGVGHYCGFDKSHRMARLAALANAAEGYEAIRVFERDTLADVDIDSERYDAIITNPPFGVTLTDSYLSSLGGYSAAEIFKKIPIEIAALEKAARLLNASGWISIVLPEGLLANDAYSSFRRWLSKYVTIRAVIGLPPTTFSPFGAAVRSSILFAQKCDPKDSDKVFCGVIENVGYDSNFKLIPNSDVDEMTSELMGFVKEFV